MWTESMCFPLTRQVEVRSALMRVSTGAPSGFDGPQRLWPSARQRWKGRPDSCQISNRLPVDAPGIQTGSTGHLTPAPSLGGMEGGGPGAGQPPAGRRWRRAQGQRGVPAPGGCGAVGRPGCARDRGGRRRGGARRRRAGTRGGGLERRARRVAGRPCGVGLGLHNRSASRSRWLAARAARPWCWRKRRFKKETTHRGGRQPRGSPSGNCPPDAMWPACGWCAEATR